MSRLMKESGIEYIGKIPENWKILKVKQLYSMQTGFTPDTKVPDYYDDENGYTWVNIKDLSFDKYIEDSEHKISKLYLDEKNPKIIPKGSLLFSFKLSLGQVAFAKEDLYSNEAIVSFLDSDDVNLDFLYYSSSLIKYNANENIYGAKILNQTLIQNAPITFPPLDEQKEIAEYLDKTINKINKIINANINLIQLFEEYKNAVITEVVFNGISDVEMKQTNFEWIQEIPKHWQLDSFKHVFKERNEKNNPIKSKTRLSLSIDKGVTLYSEKTTNLDRFKEDFTKYKLAYEGDLVLNSMNMIVGAVGISDYFGCVSPVYYTYFPVNGNNITTKYFEYLLKSKTMKGLLRSLGQGVVSIDRGDDRINTCRLKVQPYDLKNIMVPIPPIDEQELITNYLNNICENIDELINEKIILNEKLEEYKNSLIYECVTGKIEID